LLRRDIIDIIAYGKKRNLWVVVGTNGVLISESLANVLKKAGARGLALSLDALDHEVHDRFRRVKGAWQNTVNGAAILNSVGLPFIVQTTVGKHNIHELSSIAEFAFETLKAKVFNLYFLVQSGRGTYVSDLSPSEYNSVLSTLQKIQKEFDGKMMVNAKCAPHFFKTLYESDPQSKFLKQYSAGAGGCPAGTHYMGIRPNGDMTPCPYLPVFGGNLKEVPLADIWNHSPEFVQIRDREKLCGRCGNCEFSGACGGCRARAYGTTTDFMNEDPLCDYAPGKYARNGINSIDSIQYGIGESAPSEVVWEEEALVRLTKIPAFVRGMVKKRILTHCQKK
jgi:radical SAM protein with 4Fe4S-binding SPASM domain